MITSPSNPKLRYVRKLAGRRFREREGRLAVEGVRLVGDALDAGLTPAFALVAEPLASTERGRTLAATLSASGAPVLEVEPTLLAEVADTVTPQGVVAVFDLPEIEPPTRPELVLVLDQVRDPGNVGTMIRTALAAGADAVIAAPGTVDVWSPKVVRGGMGAHFRLPVLALGWDAIRRRGRDWGLAAWVADGAAETAHTGMDWTAPAMLVVGGEADGPSAEGRALGPGVKVPMPGPAESLNAAVAAAVILFEAARQRSAAT
ncbi:MAG: TrmH family RNA methyltransferase [Anaerolineae bacterium]